MERNTKRKLNILSLILATSQVFSYKRYESNEMRDALGNKYPIIKSRRKGFTNLPHYIKPKLSKPTKKRLKVKQARKAYVQQQIKRNKTL